MKNVFKLKDEALSEAYEYFDKNVRSLPKGEDGKVDQYANGLADNDVDAFRHAYVSGVFAKELGTGEAKFYGFLQELLGGNGSSDITLMLLRIWIIGIMTLAGNMEKTRRVVINCL